jgi:phage baseplate assembly protein W
LTDILATSIDDHSARDPSRGRAIDHTTADSATLATKRALVGRGLAFPLVVDHTGALMMSTGDDVGPAIRMVIMTAPGERPMRPEFGCAIWDHMYDPINAATLGQMAHAVRAALARWEPRIEVDRVTVTPERSDGAVVSIEVDYRLRSSNDRRNLVFPFYVIPGGEHS